MRDRVSGKGEAVKVVALRERKERTGSPFVLTLRLIGRAGLDAAAFPPTTEPFRACLAALAIGDSIRVRLATGRSAPLSVLVSMSLKRDRGASDPLRPQVVGRTLAAALQAAYHGRIFAAEPNGAQEEGRLAHAEVLRPQPGRLATWQAHALRRTPQPKAVAMPSEADVASTTGEAPRPEIGSRLSLSSAALAVVLRGLAQPITIDLTLKSGPLTAAELRRLGAIEQRLCEDLRQSDDPLVDLMSAEDLIRLRIVTRERIALRLEAVVRSTAALSPSELDLISYAIFDAPVARMTEAPDAADVSALLPRSVAPRPWAIF